MTNTTQMNKLDLETQRGPMAKTSMILVILMILVSLAFAAWAGSQAFEDSLAPFAAIAMMGMMGYIFHAVILLIMFKVESKIRQYLAIALLTWHIPEALLIAFFTMGVPDGKMTGIIIHSAFCVAAFVIYWLEGKTR